MLPVIDAGTVEGLVISSGYSGHGLGISPGAGRLTAELALGAAHDSDAMAEAAAFSAARFSENIWMSPSSLV
jgi:glycine/D-amino acid oxidase-like deaminating enzyme